MNAESLREILKRSPFEPFEVRMSSGEVHQIRHPEFAMVTTGRLVVVEPTTDRIAILSLFHITEPRMLQAATKDAEMPSDELQNVVMRIRKWAGKPWSRLS